MKKKIMSLALMLVGLASCNNEEIISQGGSEVLPEGYSGITIKVATTKNAGTRAVGDTLNVLTDKEKEIKSIAFFVENVDGFKSYFSDETDPAKKLDIPLNKVTDIEYTASIRVTGEQFGASEVVLIANYAENGLTTDLKALTSMATLKAKTLSITDNAQTPLLMYSAKSVTLKNGERLAESFDMTRMVGRIDIINLAQKATPADGFELQSARLVNAKTQAYLVAGATGTQVKTLPVDAANTFSLRTAGKNTSNQQVVDTLYTYENPNTEAATATAIELVGTFKNAPVVKLVNFEKFNTITKKYEPIAIQRNYRYLVEITPARDEHDVELTIKVKDWEAADTIQVEAKKDAPVLKDIVRTGGADWKTTLGGKTIKTLDISSAKMSTAQTLTFTTEEQQECDFELELYGNQTDKNWIKVEKIKVEGYAAADPTAKIKTYFTVTIPAYTATTEAERIGLRRAYIRILNSIDKTKCDTIQILQRVPWVNANAPAGCLVKGIWWAPMNLGATTYDVTTAVTTGNITAKQGKLYQWGRKYGFDNNNATTPTLATEWPTQADLPDMETNAKWQNKFIPATTTPFNSQGNWFRINSTGDNPAASDLEVDAWYRKLWNANEVAAANGTVIKNPKKTTADPCPEGWRVPTRYEWETIGAGTTILTPGFDATNKFYRIDADNGETQLSLPTAGYRNSISGVIEKQASSGRYWTSSASAGSNVSAVSFYAAPLSQGTEVQAFAYSVRCVQE